MSERDTEVRRAEEDLNRRLERLDSRENIERAANRVRVLRERDGYESRSPVTGY